MDLGSSVKFFRTGKDMTLHELANLSGVSLSHLSLIENNKRDPSILIVKRIATAMGVPMIILLYPLEIEDVIRLDLDLAAKLSLAGMRLIDKKSEPTEGAS